MGGHLLLVTLKLDRGVVLPHPASPRHGLAAVDVQLGVVLAAVPLGAHLMIIIIIIIIMPLGAHLVRVLEHLDPWGWGIVKYISCVMLCINHI